MEMVDKVRKEKTTKNAGIVAGGRNKKKVSANLATKKTVRKTPTTVAKKNLPATAKTVAKKNLPATAKKASGTLKKIGNVAKNVVRSPVGKFGIPGALATAAYYGYKEFAGKKKKPVAKKPTPKNKAPIQKRKLSPGESKIRKSDIMGGSKGRLSGPKGPLGGKLDERKKSTVVKNRNRRFDPTKANRAGQKFGQR